MSSRDDYIQKLVDSAPPLTSEQRDRLAVLLRSESKPPAKELRKRATHVDEVANEV